MKPQHSAFGSVKVRKNRAEAGGITPTCIPGSPVRGVGRRGVRGGCGGGRGVAPLLLFVTDVGRSWRAR